MTLPENQVLPEEQKVYIDRYKQMDEEAKAKEKETTSTSEKKGFIKNEKLIAIMSGIALLVVIGGYTANKIFNKNQPVATEIETPITPAETPQVIIESAPTMENTVEVLPTIESLEIDASLISNPEELVKTFENNRSTAWFNAGSTPENAKLWSDTKTGAQGDEFIEKTALKYDQIFIDALYVKDWQSHPKLVENINRMKSIHKNTLEMYFMTSSPDLYPQDKEPFNRGVEVTKVYPNNPVTIDGIRQITIISVQHDYDNAMMNRIGIENNEGVTGENNQPTVTYAIIGSKLKISDITY